MSAATKNAAPRLSSITMKPFEVTESTITTADLTLLDRCDRCGAAAYVRAVKDESQLLFCGNHGRKTATKLIASGWSLDDQTHKAFQKPAPPEDSE